MNENMVKIVIETDEGAWHGKTAERLWASRVRDNLYQLENSPLYVYGLSYKDVVVARAFDKNQVLFESVAERGGHSTYRVVLEKLDTKAEFQTYWSPIEKIGCTYESSRDPENVFAIDVPPNVDADMVYSLLEEGENAGVWEFEEGYCGHPLIK